MRHAREAALERLQSVIAALRDVPGLVERKYGVFYRHGRAFIHFHEDADALYADMRRDTEFDRHEVTTQAQRRAFLAEVARRTAS